MSKEILTVVETVSNEKAIPKEKLFHALEMAIATAIRKRYPQEVEIRVEIDRKTGNIESYRRWLVVESVQRPTQEMTLEAMRLEDPTVELGSYFELPLETVTFDRISTQFAKQVIIQKVKEAERDAIIAQCLPNVSQLVTGTVKKNTREALILDLGNGAEGILPRTHMIPKESFRMGDRVRAVLEALQPEGQGAHCLLSRICPEMLGALLTIEVPEVGEGVIEIKAIARDPGSRAKVAVRTRDQRIDPVGASTLR